MKKIFLIITIMCATILSVVKAQNAPSKTAFNKTLQAYFDTKNALAKDNVTSANVSAKSLVAAISTFPVKSLSATQQILWKTQAEVIKKSADAIVQQKDLKEQRKSFWALSSAMLKLTKEIKLNNYDVYVQYCPMAKKSWLNEVEDVQNPFYGSMMYDCGEVTETIAKK
ncbi:DUF3347 domain-containing protein [Pedobacter boryungensis]|uniref:DUF3347 domain-containing protein n=1 Tax=Pedobacter boryungensis TaxID=869962 RepID=A0ABX2DBL7_9SPHI|nr:DUF3347 domain-containing protein [Pedobacter boryungensis]NQX31458.1 DUF3347 domain-containing protein [Pedobacter boryungensis]